MVNHTMSQVQNATYDMEIFLFNMLGDVMQRAQRVPGVDSYAMLAVMVLLVLILIIYAFKNFLPQRDYATERDSPQHNATQLPM